MSNIHGEKDIIRIVINLNCSYAQEIDTLGIILFARPNEEIIFRYIFFSFCMFS